MGYPGVELGFRDFFRQDSRPVIEENLENIEMLTIQQNTYYMAVGDVYIPQWIDKTINRISGPQFEEYQRRPHPYNQNLS